MKRLIITAALMSASLTTALADPPGSSFKADKFKDNGTLLHPNTKFTPIDSLQLKDQARQYFLVPNLYVGQFNATRYKDRVAVQIIVENAGPGAYKGGRSYVVEEFMPGGGSRVLMSGPLPVTKDGGYQSYLAWVPLENRAHTFMARLTQGDLEPKDDVRSCSIQADAPDQTKHPRDRGQGM